MKRARQAGTNSAGVQASNLKDESALPSQLDFEKSRPYEGLDYDVTDDEQPSEDSSQGSDEEDQDNLQEIVKKAKLAIGDGDDLAVLEAAEELYEKEQQGQGTRKHLLHKLQGNKESRGQAQGIPLSMRQTGQQHILTAMQANGSVFTAYKGNFPAAAAAIEIECHSKSKSKMTYQSNLANTVRAVKKAANSNEITALSGQPIAADSQEVAAHLDELEGLSGEGEGGVDLANALKILRQLAVLPVTKEIIAQNQNGKRLKKLTKHINEEMQLESEYALMTWMAFVKLSTPKI